MTEGQPPSEPNINIMIDPANMAGVYANYARVSHSPFEFTVDFVRLDWTNQPPQGIVVARIALSPLMVDQLITALRRNWSLYAEKAMPPEVQDAQKSVEDLGDTGHEPPSTPA
jgi:hypothetical protein